MQSGFLGNRKINTPVQDITKMRRAPRPAGADLSPDSPARKQGRFPKLSLLGKFSLVSLVLMLVLASLLVWGIQTQLEGSALQQEAASAADQVKLAIQPKLTPSDFSGPLSAGRLSQIDAIVRQNLLNEHIVRIKLWAPDGTVRYSDDPSLINQKFSVDDDLKEAFEGKMSQDVSSLDAAENVAERAKFSRLMEVYVPLRLPGTQTIVGVCEFYHDLEVVEPRIAEMRQFVVISIGLGFLVLFGSLFTLVRNASSDLRRHSDANAHLYAEARQRLLERRAAEDALLESEEHFRLLFASNPLPMWLYDLESHKFLEANDATIVKYGYSREELLNMTVDDLRWPGDTSPSLDQLVFMGRESGNTAQMRHRVQKGDKIDVQVSSHLLELKGRKTALVVAEDITERKRAEQALRESERRFRAMFDGAAMGVALLDRQGKLLQTNGSLQTMLGYANTELRGRSFSELTHPDDLGANTQLFTQLIEGKIDHYQMEKRYFCKDGRTIWGNLTVSRILDSQGQIQFVIGMIENITDRKFAQEQVEMQLRRLDALRSIDMAITASVDLRVTLSVVLDKVTAQLGVDAADVLLLNAHTHVLEFAAGRGFLTDARANMKVRLGEGYAGRAALERRIISRPDLKLGTGFLSTNSLEEEGFAAYFAVPLISKGQVQGVLEVFNKNPLAPDATWFGFMEALAGQTAIAVDNATLFHDLQRSNVELALAYDTTLEGWSRALDLRDKETEGHTRRVTEMTIALARAMGVSEADIVQIRRGALLHDIGKMGIPDAILLKPGPLTEAEWDIMKRHPVYAHELLAPVPFLRPALDIPYSHHEKWDGTGYPRGLRREEIALSARIFAVVDVWDALRSDRPYRAAWPEDRVLSHIQSLSGTHFDPHVVECFLQMMSGQKSSAPAPAPANAEPAAVG